MEYKYISADNHLDLRWMPRRTWQDRVAARFKDRAPRIVETPDGTYWEWEGRRREPAADGQDHPKFRAHFAAKGVEIAEGALPPADPRLLLEHLDRAHTYAAVLYGPTRKWHMEDAALRQECYRAYNDFVLEVNSYAPDRILILPNLPVMFPETCAAELRRVARLGAKAVEFSMFDTEVPLYEPAWEPVWSTAEETGLPLCFHVGDRAGTPYPPNVQGRLLAHFSLTPFLAAPTMSHLVFGAVLERHPSLRVSFAECRIGWLPFFINWMDRQVHEREPDPTAPLSLLPSEYFKRQVTVTFEDDLIGARLLREPWACLAETAMWGADWPHPQGIWPDPDPIMAKLFEGVDPGLQRTIVFDRAARFFGIRTPVSA